MISFSAAISACEKGGQWQRVLSLLEDICRAGKALDVISFSTAISACEKGGQWQHALSLSEDMCKAGVTPNVISFNAASPHVRRVGGGSTRCRCWKTSAGRA